jgi:SnoaL-like domain
MVCFPTGLLTVIEAVGISCFLQSRGILDQTGGPSMPPNSTSLDLTMWWKAIESRDAEAQIPLYADDAVVTVVNPDHPPRYPITFRTRKAISSWIKDICALNMYHRVVDVVDGGDRVSFTEEGRYRDGAQVWSMSTVFLQNGLITRQRVVLVWDGLD